MRSETALTSASALSPTAGEPGAAEADAAKGRIEVRAATEADNDALLALTRATPMTGSIWLRIDRDPDFFRLLRLRGEGVVFVAARGREVLACISGSLRTAYVSGKPETVGYVGDMKVHPRFAGSRLVLRVIRALEAWFRSRGRS